MSRTVLTFLMVLSLPAWAAITVHAAPTVQPTVLSKPCLTADVRPADPGANPDARKILTYLTGLPTRPDRRVISGQFIGHGEYSSMKDFEAIHQQTGKWLAMIAIDYGLNHATSYKGNPYAIDYWKRGGLVTVSFHALNPATRTYGSVKSRNVELADILREGSAVRKAWLADLDTAAEGLQELRDAGVVVLWRPFHEMNKDFFWWGKRDPKEFTALWRDMFRYYTEKKGLHNLLWVYSPYQASDAAAYYPGDDVVDVVGLDAYETKMEKIQGVEALAALNKPMGFTEFGPSGFFLGPLLKVDKNFDYFYFIEQVRARFPKISFFTSWGGPWGLQAHRNADKLLHDPWVVTLENLDWRSCQ